MHINYIIINQSTYFYSRYSYLKTLSKESQYGIFSFNFRKDHSFPEENFSQNHETVAGSP